MSLFSDFIKDTQEFVTEDVVQRPHEQILPAIGAGLDVWGAAMGIPTFGMGTAAASAINQNLWGGGGSLSLRGGGGASDIPMPGPEAGQEDWQRWQREIIQRQIEDQMALQEFQAQQQGFRRVVSPEGSVSYERIPYAELTPEQQRRYDVQAASDKRLLQAFRGELPISAGLERDISSSLEKAYNLAETYGGPGSTAGANIIAKAEQAAQGARESVRRGEISEGFARYQFFPQMDLANQSSFQNIQRGGLDIFSAIQSPLNRQASRDMFSTDVKTRIALGEMEAQAAREAGVMELFGTGITALPFIL